MYNLAADPAEQANLATQEPARPAELRDRFERWRHEVGAKMPTVNPAFKPKK